MPRVVAGVGGDGGGRPGEGEAVGGCGGSRVDGVGVAAPRQDSPPDDTRGILIRSVCSHFNKGF